MMSLVMALNSAVKQQGITWANYNPVHCHDMASLGQNELMIMVLK